MRVIGLTGGIASGKSTIAAFIHRRWRVPVFDADKVVRILLEKGNAGELAVLKAFPEMIKDGTLDKAALAVHIFSSSLQRKKLESILHPLVRKEQTLFLKRARRARRRMVILDIPLLYETGGDKHCDAVLFTTAPMRLRLKRAMKRPQMNKVRFMGAVAAQLPDAAKRKQKPIELPTGLGTAFTWRRLQRYKEYL